MRVFRFDTGLRVYVHREAVDFRKSINGLAALVEQGLRLDPFGRTLFVFGNRHRNRVKILGWERNGFWLLMKRLEAERFTWPRVGEAVIEITIEQLHWLLDGIDLEAMRTHRMLRFARAS
jgi:transposase